MPSGSGLKSQMIVSNEEKGLRLDLFLAHELGKHQNRGLVSRSSIQRLISAGAVTLNGRAVKSGARVKAADRIEVEWPPAAETDLEPEALPLHVLFEDEDLIVINKAPGMVVHPAAGSQSGTLVHALLYHCPNLPGIGGERRPGIVHRLDKDTSGVMVVVKSQSAFGDVSRQFRERLVVKEYVCLTWGRPAATRGTIARPIGRHRAHRKKMSSLTPVRRSREAVTDWQLEQSFRVDSQGSVDAPAVSVIRVRPRTGRTHQIRVHLADEGCPIVGDRTYGRKIRARDGIFQQVARFPRQALHAEKLGLTHPRTGRFMEFRAPLAEDMKSLLDLLSEST